MKQVIIILILYMIYPLPEKRVIIQDDVIFIKHIPDDKCDCEKCGHSYVAPMDSPVFIERSDGSIWRVFRADSTKFSCFDCGKDTIIFIETRQFEEKPAFKPSLL